MPDETTDVVQPDAGQGDGGTSGGPWSDLLSRVPEDDRGEFESRFKEWDGNYTRHQQEAADYRKTWEPYEQLGVNQYSPDQLSYLMQLGQALEDPQQMQEWWNQYAQQNGLTQAEQQQQQEQFDGYQDPTAQLLDEKLSPIQQRLEAFAQWQEQQEFAVREQDALQYIEGQLKEAEEKHPGLDRNLVEALVGQYVESDPQNAVPRAVEDAQKWIAQIEKQTLQSKVGSPPGAESGGVPDTTPEQIRTLKEAGEIAKQRIRDSWQS